MGWPPCDVQSLETCESGRWEDRFECQEATAEAEGSLGRSKCGVLMRRNNAEAVLQMPTNADQGADWFIHEVNRAWAGLFLELGLKDDDVDALRGVLDVGAPGVTDEGQSRRDRFKSVLGIDEFTWMSYSYLYNEQHMADPLG